MTALRKIARGVARANMKRMGMVQTCKHKTKMGVQFDSWFSDNWKDYIRPKRRK